MLLKINLKLYVTNKSVKKLGQKSVMEIVCVNNHFKGGIISKLEQFYRFFLLNYLSEAYLTFLAIFGRKIGKVKFIPVVPFSYWGIG
jgi:hypothetical protein